MYLKIKNDGLIESGALSLLGASDKRDSDKIGQFGSGNKYSLAFMIRNGWDFRIYSGTKQIKVGTKKEIFRSHSFDVIYIDEEKTSITSDMGNIDWKPWSVIRELYSNAIDEGGEHIGCVDTIRPVEGETHFYITLNADTKEILRTFDKYFRIGDKRVIAKTPHGTLLSKLDSDINIYRKGIRCYHGLGTSMFDYDFNGIEINESRIVKYHWDIQKHVWNVIFNISDREVILKAIKGSCIKGSLENNIGMGTMSPPSAGFTAAISDLKLFPYQYAGMLEEGDISKYTLIHEKLFEIVTGKNIEDIINFQEGLGAWRIIEPNGYQKKILDDALHFLRECSWRSIPYEIKVASFTEPDIFGAAVGGEILISDNALDQGVQTVVEAIIEEYVHLKYDCRDNSRKMQSTLIRELITYMKQKNAYTL